MLTFNIDVVTPVPTNTTLSPGDDGAVVVIAPSVVARYIRSPELNPLKPVIWPATRTVTIPAGSAEFSANPIARAFVLSLALAGEI
jgi:hypothetical protein